MLILDISCQHLGDECKFEGFCVPFGNRVGECTLLEIYICIGYMMLYIYKLEGFCVPFRHKVGDSTFLEIYIFVLDI